MTETLPTTHSSLILKSLVQQCIASMVNAYMHDNTCQSSLNFIIEVSLKMVECQDNCVNRYFPPPLQPLQCAIKPFRLVTCNTSKGVIHLQGL